MSVEEISNDMKIQGLNDYEGWGPSDHEHVDLKIISSDNYCLWVSSKQLIHHSYVFACGDGAAADFARPVFSAVISTCGDKADKVQLTDTDIETAFSLEATFGILAAIDENNQHNLVVAMDRLATDRVVRLAEKYDMKLVSEKIRYHLFSIATQYPPSGGHLWLAAAHMSEWALCGRLVASICTGHQGPLAVLTRKMLDWRGWTPGTVLELGRVSSKFLWSVCQAGAKQHIPGATANYINYQGMGEDLAKLMLM